MEVLADLVDLVILVFLGFVAGLIIGIGIFKEK